MQSLGVLEYNGKVFALPVIEIISKSAFFNFESKYNPDKLATEVCPALMSEPLKEELQRQALLIHTHLYVALRFYRYR